MNIKCPRCGRQLLVLTRMVGHLVGCPFCKARFVAPVPPREPGPSRWDVCWYAFLEGSLIPFRVVARFLKFFWHGLMSILDGGQGSSPNNGQRSGHGNARLHATSHALAGGLLDDDDDDLDDDDDIDGDEDYDDLDEESSRARQYYDSHGSFIGYRDAAGWFHGEGGRNYMGYMDDNGSFYDGSGMYRGQVEDSGFLWEDRNGYAGSHEGGGYSEEGHYGVPDVYEDGGSGTGGAFDSLSGDDEDDDN